MQIIIDIPEEDYIRLRDEGMFGNVTTFKQAVRNGTPLLSMTKRTKSEQKAYLDGYEMCADCIEKYLTNEGKQKLECLLASVRDAVENEEQLQYSEAKRKLGSTYGSCQEARLK